jgi:hypothetical protein
MSDTIDFTIISYNLEGNSIVVRPHSPDFKNDPNSYPAFNLQITTLNENQDILAQIANRIRPAIQSILLSEADTSSYSQIVSSLSAGKYSVPIVSVNDLNNFTIQVSAIQNEVNVTIGELNNTFNNMLSTQLFENINFLN